MLGLQEIVVSVFNLDRAAAPFVELGGYVETHLADASPGERSAWHVPAECHRVEQRILQLPGESTGAIRLIKFHGVEQELIRPSPRSWNTGGICSFDVWSKDGRQLFDRLQRDYGWSSHGEPVDFLMGPYDLTEVMALGPDGLGLSIVEARQAGDFEMRYGAMSRVFNIVQMVRDFEPATHFFREILGWTEFTNIVLEKIAEPGLQSLGLPAPIGEETARLLAMYSSHGPSDGGCEVMELTALRGFDYADRALAPNVGPLFARFAVENARAYADQIQSRGADLYSMPTEIEIAPYGSRWSFSVRAPDGAIFEFISAA